MNLKIAQGNPNTGIEIALRQSPIFLESLLLCGFALAAGAVAGSDGDAYGRAGGDCAGGAVDPAAAIGRRFERGAAFREAS